MIQVQGLKKHFRFRHGLITRLRHPDHVIKAVDGVSFDIKEGETLGLVGESGCGKTTLAKTMLRLHLPTGGRVLYRGRDILSMGKKELKALRREVQVIFQDSNSTLDPRMTLGSILEEPLRIHHVGNRDLRKQRVAEMMEKVKLSPAFLSRHPSELSGGQRQRISIGRALLLEPRFIVADEPLAGLDPIVSTQLLDLMLSLKRDYGLTYLFISHDLDTVAYVSDRIGVMYRGKIVEIMNAERFESRARHPYTRFLLTPAPRASEPALDGGVHFRDQRSESGCLFSKKCPHSTQLCAELSPPLREIVPGHQVACHLAD